MEEVLDPKLQIERLVSDDRYVCVLKTIGQGDRDRLIGRFHHVRYLDLLFYPFS